LKTFSEAYARQKHVSTTESSAPLQPSGIGSWTKPQQHSGIGKSEARSTTGCAPSLAGGTARGQASLIDLVMGFFIFVIVFTSVMGTINNNYKDIIRNNELEELEHLSFFVSKELTETSGFPEEWETLDENSVQKIGLTDRRNSVSEEKIVAFANMTYDRTKEILGLEGYDYFFVFDGEDYITAGLSPISQTKYLISTKRIVEYKGSEAEVELQVYTLWE